MNEGYRVEKKDGKEIAHFQDIEMVSEVPVVKDVKAAIRELKAARIFILEGKDNVQDYFMAVLFPKDGTWPELATLPSVIRDTFQQALAEERKRNPHIDSMACHISVRLQGNRMAKSERESTVCMKKKGKERSLFYGMHFDGNVDMGELSEYFVTVSGPGTIQYLGTSEISEDSEGTLYDSHILSYQDLRATSLLPNRLYHLTSKTPHARPITLDTHISDKNPRLFLRFMFGEARKLSGRVGGVVYRGE